MESPAYSSMHLGGMGDIPGLLSGYSDPPGYRSARGDRLDRFDPYRHLDRYRLALEGTELACGRQTLKARLPRASFEITKVEGRTVELAQPLSAELAQPGGYVRSGQTAFAIETVEGRRVTFRDFPFEGGKEIVAPSAVWLAAQPQKDTPRLARRTR